METLVLCDTNILIDLYKNVERVVNELKIIEEKNLTISVITASEISYGARNKKELQQILQDIKSLKILQLTEEIGVIHLDLIAEFSLSHGLNIPDALIAATAIFYEVPLFTLNRKDFHFIPGLQLYTPSWVQ